jgi:cytochrome c
MTKPRLYCGIAILSVVFWLMTAFVFSSKNAPNSPPKVFIANPVVGAKLGWNEVVRYSIKINDLEDGNSEYNEINTNEVLLEVSYFNNLIKAKAYMASKEKMVTEHPGLTLLKNSDCFTCHASKGKLIGPSFELIAKKYPESKAVVDNLTSNVINGVKGVWGPVAMPPHKAMKAADIKQVINWILAKNNNADITYYPGIEGSFRTRQKPPQQHSNEVIVLTASYMDHGDKGSMQNRKFGQHSVLLKAVE